MAENLGISNGQLTPCPDSPNCVSSQADPADDTHYMAPLAYTVSAEAAMGAVRDAVDKTARSTIIRAEDNYLHAEVRSAVFRFVDDVEVYLDDEAKLLHFRSASRVGKGDLGVNRKRMQDLAETLKPALD